VSARDQAPATRDEAGAVRAYHALSSHEPYRYAPGPGGLDWHNQPDPFRRYAGAEAVALDHLSEDEGAAYEDALYPGALPPAALERASLSALLEYALGLAAWKQLGGARWALRIDPSSGNLHPTEASVVSGPVAGVCATPFVAHYAPREHALELRARLPDDLWAELAAGLPAGALLLGLSSIPWRESWKYGERAYRYCQLDLGHALACVALSAGALGWSVRACDGWGAQDLELMLGLSGCDPQELEMPELLLALAPQAGAAPVPPDAARLRALSWCGRPNRLSAAHVPWPALERVATVCRPRRGRPAPEPARRPPPAGLEPRPCGRTFRQVARARRSAVEMDGRTALAPDAFQRMLARTLPAAGARAFAALSGEPCVDLCLYVHRVADLDPGLYALVREPRRRGALAAAMSATHSWRPAPGAPAELGLTLLRRGDERAAAAAVACGQDIAADGAFALAMLVDLERALEEGGAAAYPRLYRECGAIGQVLYLEAVAAGVSATGIGCFFDHAARASFGLAGGRFQSLYHFTVGGALADERLQSLPPYLPPPE